LENKIKYFRKFYSKFEDDDIEIVGFNPSQIYNYQNLNYINTFNEFAEFWKLNNAAIHYKNRFLEIITQKLYLQTWVDIENEYYKALKAGFLYKERLIEHLNLKDG
jgi:hypothetical protein